MKSNNKAKEKKQSTQITISTTFLGSDLALAIDYLNSHCQYGKAMAADAIVARIAPFVVPKNNPDWQALAIRSANLLEAWAKSIREYGNLPKPSTVSSQYEPSLDSLVRVDGDRDNCDRLDLDLIEEDNNPKEQIESQLKQIGLY